jgi:hypothetical protein
MFRAQFGTRFAQGDAPLSIFRSALPFFYQAAKTARIWREASARVRTPTLGSGDARLQR